MGWPPRSLEHSSHRRPSSTPCAARIRACDQPAALGWGRPNITIGEGDEPTPRRPPTRDGRSTARQLRPVNLGWVVERWEFPATQQKRPPQRWRCIEATHSGFPWLQASLNLQRSPSVAPQHPCRQPGAGCGDRANGKLPGPWPPSCLLSTRFAYDLGTPNRAPHPDRQPRCGAHLPGETRWQPSVAGLLFEMTSSRQRAG